MKFVTLTVRPFSHSFLKPALVALFISAIYSPLSHAEESFADAYHAYQAAAEHGDRASIEATAQKAFELGQGKYANDSDNYAALMMNWAKAIVDNASAHEDYKAQRQQAYKLYQQALNIYQQHYGKGSPQTADALLGMATSSEQRSEAKSFGFAAVRAAEHDTDKLNLAAIQFKTYLLLAKQYPNERSIQRLADAAYETRKALLPADSIERVESELTVAQVHMAYRRYDDAEPMLKDVIKQFSVLPFTHPYALTAHTLLIRMYEIQHKPKLATEHCQAIGKMRPWDDNQEQQPLYRVSPNYPLSAARAYRDGYVDLTFIVDKNGFVKDPEVVESQGGKGFENATVEAIKQWRYAPKFEDGKPVDAETHVRLDFKIGHS